MIITAIDCWNNARKDHARYFDKNVKARLHKHKKGLTTRVHKFLVSNHTLVRDGREDDFRKLHSELDTILLTLAPITQVKVRRKLRKVYDYSAFQKKKENNWGAYELCKSLSVLTCPYCNLAYGHTVCDASGPRFRPTLDHFFDKASFPLFAISLGNLVPSCYHCNSSLKGTVNFFQNPHLNPLCSDEKIAISLDVDAIKARYDLTVFDTAAIKLDFDTSDVRARNSARTFCLTQRYQHFVDDARFIARGMAGYVSPVVPNPVELERLEWLKRGVTKANYRNRIMGKMIMDFTGLYLSP